MQAFHFLNSGGGGTLSVVQNLLRFSAHDSVQHHVIYTVNKKTDPGFKALGLKGALSEQVFFYSANWNFYYTCKKMAALLPPSDAVLVAHDWIELGMASALGLPHPVVQFLHGDFEYYYRLAAKHQQAIDKFIAVSPVIAGKLQQQLGSRSSDIKYARFPVPAINSETTSHDPLRIVYCVNSLNEERKQFELLPKINARLKELNIKAHWTIVGKGYTEAEVKNRMQQEEQLDYFNSLDNEAVHALLTQQDIFLLPSLSEGFPVSVVEAMKAGTVPLISNWNNATAELVKEGETGFYFELGDADRYAQCIASLQQDRRLLQRMAAAAVQLANSLFDPFVNTRAIEQIILGAAADLNKRKQPERVYGSRLDRQWMPNFITTGIRSLGNN